MPVSSKKIFLFYSLFICLSFVLVLFSLEIFLRVFTNYEGSKFTVRGADAIYPVAGLTTGFHFTFDPATGYSMIKNLEDKGQHIHTNADGFRIVSKPFDPALESIVFVGDSTVFGWGIADEDSYPYLLSKLNGLRNFNIVNTGVPSFSLSNIVATLKHKVPQLKPKIVFVEILWPWKPFESYSNAEAWKKVDFDFYRQTIPVREKYIPDPPDKKACLSCKFIKDYWIKVKYASQIKKNLTRPGVRDFNLSEEQERQLAMDHVVLLKETEQVLPNVEIIYFIHPYQYTIFHPDYVHLGKLGKEIFKSELKALDPTDFVKANYNERPFYIDGSHLTPEGSRVFCKFFAEQLRQLAPEINPSECEN